MSVRGVGFIAMPRRSQSVSPVSRKEPCRINRSISASGTYPTCRGGLTISAGRGQPEGALSKRRDLTDVTIACAFVYSPVPLKHSFRNGMQQVESPEPPRALLRPRVCGLFRYAFNVVPARAGTYAPRPLVCCLMVDGLRFEERRVVMGPDLGQDDAGVFFREPNDQSTGNISVIVEYFR